MHRRKPRAIVAFHRGTFFLTKKDALSMFYVQAQRWTQVAPKSSQNSTKIAPKLPKMAPRWTQVAPESSQDSPKMAPTLPKMAPLNVQDR